MRRPTKIDNWVDIAREVSKRSPCTRRKFGALIIKDGIILSTGYNGSARGTLNCGMDIPCLKDLYNEKSALEDSKHNVGSFQYCTAVHAEENAVINAARVGISIEGSEIILASALGICTRPCARCRRVLINAGIVCCYYVDGKDNDTVKVEVVNDWIEMENKWMLEMVHDHRVWEIKVKEIKEKKK